MRITMLFLLAAVLLLTGCSGDNAVQPQGANQNALTAELTSNPGHGSFALEAKFSKIDSYPTGRGIFLVRLLPGEDFVGNVDVTINANSKLNAGLYRTVLNEETGVTEVTIDPSHSIALGSHFIELTASNMDNSETIMLEVEIVDWVGSGGYGYGQEKLDEFIPWLEVNYPELGTFSDRQWDIFATYPGILVVMHYTFLDMDWELRISYHVMIPPYDWSRMYLRPRGEWDGIFAAKRECVDGVNYIIHEIPVEDYGILY